MLTLSSRPSTFGLWSPTSTPLFESDFLAGNKIQKQRSEEEQNECFHHVSTVTGQLGDSARHMDTRESNEQTYNTG